MPFVADIPGKGFFSATMNTTDTQFTKIKNALHEAVHEPEHVPAELMSRVTKRCEAISAGHQAEILLNSGSKMPAEEVYELVAASVLGQLALKKDLPANRSVPETIRLLSQSKELRAHLDGTPENALNCIKSGVLVKGDFGAPQKQNGPAKTPVQRNGGVL